MAISVVAHLRAKTGKEQELKKSLLPLLDATRKEKGCRQYRLYQNKQDGSDLTFIEEWEDDAALDAHLQTPHLLAAIAGMSELVDGAPDVRRYILVG